MDKPAGHLYEFGPFRLDTRRRLLLRDEVPVAVMPKAFETLLVLVESCGRIIDKDDLMNRVWPDTSVDEAGLTRNISVLRKLLGDSPDAHNYIVTVPGRGYQFVAVVRDLVDGNDAQASPSVVASGWAGELEGAIARRDPVEPRLAARTSPQEAQSRITARRRIAWTFSLAIIPLAAGATYLWLSATSEPQRGGQVKSIAVLPLKPLGAGEADEYIRLGIADALITQLAHIRQIVVRPTSAVRRYSVTEKDPVTIGRELGVDAVLEGSFQQSGDRFRVTLQLVRVSDGAPFWTEKFDDKFTDIFSVQDSISKRVADALAVSLSRDERRQLAKHHTENPEAFRSYLKGRFYWNKRTEEGLRKGIEHFDQAIEQDPLYALAYAGLADCYNLLNNYDVVPANECMPKARQAAIRALEIDDTLAEAHTSLALVKEVYDWDQAGAEQEYRRAIDLNPNYPTAHHWNGLFLVQMGRPEEGLRAIARAKEIEPLSLIINVGGAWGSYYARQPDASIEQSLKTLELEPGFWAAHLVLGWAYETKGRYEEAIEEMETAIKLSGRNTLPVASLGHLYGEAGRTAEGKAILKELRERSEKRYVSSYFFAAVHAGLGDNERALEWLDRAHEERSYWLISIKVNPWFDKLRSNARFIALERRIGFAQVSGGR